MTNPLAALQEVASINPAWSRQNLPGYTPVGYANETMLHAQALTFTAENALLGECAEDHLPFLEGDILVSGNFADLRAGHCMQARLGTNQNLGFCPDRMVVLRANRTRLDARFLLHFLRQQRMQALIASYLQTCKRQFPHERANAGQMRRGGPWHGPGPRRKGRGHLAQPPDRAGLSGSLPQFGYRHRRNRASLEQAAR